MNDLHTGPASGDAGQTDIAEQQRQALRPVLNACRCMTLMDPVALQFNEITLLDPYARMVKLATVLTEAIGANEALRDLVRRDNVATVLQAQAILRKKGEFILPAAFGADPPAGDAERSR
jgi:hypothetical protein